MATDQFGNYIVGLQSAWEELPDLSGGSAKQVFGAADGEVIAGIPQVTPTTDEAIYIGDDGTQYQYFSGSWH